MVSNLLRRRRDHTQVLFTGSGHAVCGGHVRVPHVIRAKVAVGKYDAHMSITDVMASGLIGVFQQLALATAFRLVGRVEFQCAGQGSADAKFRLPDLSQLL